LVKTIATPNILNGKKDFRESPIKIHYLGLLLITTVLLLASLTKLHTTQLPTNMYSRSHMTVLNFKDPISQKAYLPKVYRNTGAYIGV